MSLFKEVFSAAEVYLFCYSHLRLLIVVWGFWHTHTHSLSLSHTHRNFAEGNHFVTHNRVLSVCQATRWLCTDEPNPPQASSSSSSSSSSPSSGMFSFSFSSSYSWNGLLLLAQYLKWILRIWSFLLLQASYGNTRTSKLRMATQEQALYDNTRTSFVWQHKNKLRIHRLSLAVMIVKDTNKDKNNDSIRKTLFEFLENFVFCEFIFLKMSLVYTLNSLLGLMPPPHLLFIH